MCEDKTKKKMEDRKVEELSKFEEKKDFRVSAKPTTEEPEDD